MEIKPNILKAEISGSIKILGYSILLLFFIAFFIYLISGTIDINMLNQSLGLLGISIPDFSGLLTNAVILLILILLGNSIFIYININKKEVKFDNENISYFDKIWVDLPYKNIVSINFSKSFFSGDKIILTLTGTSKEKIEIPYVDNAEETCKTMNELIKNEVPPIPKQI